MTLGALLVLSAIAQTSAPPSFAEIQKGMVDTYRGYRNYSDTWEMRFGEQTLVASRKLDGDRYRLEMALDGTPQFLEVWNGSTGLSVLHAQKQYRKLTVVPPYDKGPEKPEPGGFTFFQRGPYAFDLLVNPEPRILEVAAVKLDGRAARRVVAVVEGSAGEPMKTVQMWFDTDRWALRKLIAIGGQGDLHRTSMTAKITKMDREAKLDASDFAVDPATLAGYTDVTDGGSGGDRRGR